MELDLNENEKIVLEKLLKHFKNKSKKTKDNNEKLKLRFTFDALKTELDKIEKSLPKDKRKDKKLLNEKNGSDHPDDQTQKSENNISEIPSEIKTLEINETQINESDNESEVVTKKRKHEHRSKEMTQDDDPKDDLDENQNEKSDQEIKDVLDSDHPDDQSQNNKKTDNLILDTESNASDEEQEINKKKPKEQKEKKKKEKDSIVIQETFDEEENEEENQEKKQKEKKTKNCQKCFRFMKGNHKRVFICHVCGVLSKGQYTVKQECL
jgi:hypothetical protein